MDTQRQDSMDSSYGSMGSMGHYDAAVIQSIAAEINSITSSIPASSLNSINSTDFTAATDYTMGDDSVFTGNGL